MHPSKVSDRLVAEIRRRLAAGTLRTGDRLPSERELARTFGASRASVREALRVLEQAGLVFPRHGEGTFVRAAPAAASSAALSEFLRRARDRLLDLSQARQAIEPRIAALAAARATDRDLERLRQALGADRPDDRMRDVEAAFANDRAFHLAIAAATHSPTFIMLHTYLSDLVADLRREAIFNESRRSPARYADHHAIVQAIAQGSPAKAEAAMRRHLKHVERVLTDALERYQQAAADLGGRRLRGPRRPRGRRRAAFRLTRGRAAG